MVDFKGLSNKLREALGKKPDLVDKAGDAIDSKTGGKYAGQVDKAQDAAKKWSGSDTNKPAGDAPAPAPTDAPKPE